MTTTYTATPELCHTEMNYGEHLLPNDWPGKKFRFRLDDDKRVSLVEGHDDAAARSWVVTQELAEKIRASVKTEDTTEVTPETGPTATVSFEKYEADIKAEGIKTENTIIEQQREELQRLRDVITAKEVEFRTFKRRVGEVAMEYAERHDWCDTVKEALDDIGIEVPKKEYTFTLNVTYRVRGTKETYGEPDDYDIREHAYLDPHISMNMDNWGDLEVDYLQHDVMDIEEVEE